MFGKWAAIQDALPHYFVDFQERLDVRAQAQTELRWIDRLVPDGTWSGNLFEFYRRVYRKLVVDLKVPFVLNDGVRQDDTPVHEALREALVNTLVHADYSDRLSVLVVKRSDRFEFRNPGGLRLPLEQVVRGGESDCRNRILHQLFLLVGLGERGGSGIPKIFSGWKNQHWRPPLLQEKFSPDQTFLALQMLDLLPEGVLSTLHARFGPAFEETTLLERLILASVEIEQVVNHARLLAISGKHSHDVSVALNKLEKMAYLQSNGHSRGKMYHLTYAPPLLPEDLFGDTTMSSSDLSASSSDLSVSSSDLSVSSSDLSASSSVLPLRRDGDGCLLSDRLPLPVVDNLIKVSPSLRSQFDEIAKLPRDKKRISHDTLKAVILALCDGRYITLQALAVIVNRKPVALRNEYLSPMVRETVLSMAFPATPTHERQAYCLSATLPKSLSS
jgi:ATP-dependent DNA helicase RecG